MTSASQLICQRVVTGLADQRLADVAGRVASIAAHHCVVLDENNRTFVGLIRLGDIAARTDPSNRILGDLVSKADPLRVRPDESAVAVAEMFEQHGLSEAVLLANDGSYLGLITAESVLQWSLQEIRRADAKIQRDEEELREAKARLQVESQAKRRLFAAVSHELRTPLNPILLISSERAAMQGLPADIRADFQVIATNAETEAKLVEDLLNFTRTVRTANSLDSELVSIHPALETAIAKLQYLIDAKRLALVRQFNAVEPAVVIDPAKLQRVFWHILDNAIKFTPAGGSVRVETRTAANLAAFEIVFTDTGVGMAPGEVERIFAPFQQASRDGLESGRTHGGLGGGMVIAKSILDLHAGGIEAFSAGQNRGSAFTVTLPHASVSGFPLVRSAAAPFRPRTMILLVDDHDDSRGAIENLLKRRNHEVMGTGSMAEALALAEHHRFALVVSVIELRVGNGYDLMALLRQRFGLSGIAISRNGEEADPQRSKQSGFFFQLKMPVSIAALEAAIGSTLGQGDGPAQTAPSAAAGSAGRP